MKHGAYWRERFEQVERAQNAIGRETLKQIEGYYHEAQKEIEGELLRWFGRFAENNGITLQQARGWLTAGELKELQWDLQEYIKRAEENASTGEWVRELKNASIKTHIARLEALKLQTRHSLETLVSKQQATTAQGMGTVYVEGYLRTVYEIQKGLGTGWHLSTVPQNQIERVLSKPWAPDGVNFSDRIWKNKNKLINEMHGEIFRGLLLGQDPQKTINAIAKKLETSKRNAGRLVMTEQAYFSSLSQGDAFRDLDVEAFEIVATLDSHTSKICQELDGQVFPMKDYEAGVTAPPFHVWCRSTTVPYFGDEFDRNGMRAARGADGKTYYVPESMTYREWQKTFVEGEESHKGVNRATLVHRDFFRRPEWSRAFQKLPESKKTRRAIRSASMHILQERSGTEFETLVYIDEKTQKTLYNREYNKRMETRPTIKMQKLLKQLPAGSVIAIHNHPHSTLPSFQDLRAALHSGYKYGLVVCHDGKIYKYTILSDTLDQKMYAGIFDRVERKGYTLDKVQHMMRDAGFLIERLDSA